MSELRLLDREKLDKFHAKVQKMADEEFGEFEDGGSLLLVDIVDRTRYHASQFMLVRYDHQVLNGEGTYNEIEVVTEINLGLAYSDFKVMREHQKSRAYYENLKKVSE